VILAGDFMGLKIKMFILLLSFFIVLSCAETEMSNIKTPCDDITCSNRGECLINKENKAVCLCNDGYHPDGLECFLNTKECNLEEHEEDGACVSNTKYINCLTPQLPDNATKIDSEVEVTWVDGSWTIGEECNWDCNQNFYKDGNLCKSDTTITITEVRAAAIDGTYTTRGTITALDAKGFYFQDANAGMYVYLNEVPTQAVADVVIVTGVLVDYHSKLELKDATITVDSQGILPAPISVATMTEANESMYVSLTGQPFTIGTITDYYITVTGSNGSFFLKKDALTSGLVTGNVLSKLDGVIEQFDTNYRLVLRVESDMEN
jgi:hypothetical protein